MAAKAGAGGERDADEQVRELEARERAAVEGKRHEEAAALKESIAAARTAARC